MLETRGRCVAGADGKPWSTVEQCLRRLGGRVRSFSRPYG